MSHSRDLWEENHNESCGAQLLLSSCSEQPCNFNPFPNLCASGERKEVYPQPKKNSCLKEDYQFVLFFSLQELGVRWLLPRRPRCCGSYDLNWTSLTSTTVEMRTLDLPMGSSMTEEATRSGPKSRSLQFFVSLRRTGKYSRRRFQSVTISELGWFRTLSEGSKCELVQMKPAEASAALNMVMRKSETKLPWVKRRFLIVLYASTCKCTVWRTFS